MRGYRNGDCLVDIYLSFEARISTTATTASRRIWFLSSRFPRNYLGGCHAHKEMSVHASSKLRRSLMGWVCECGVGGVQISFFLLLDPHVLSLHGAYVRSSRQTWEWHHSTVVRSCLVCARGFGKSKFLISHDYYHIKKVILVRSHLSYACVHWSGYR